MRPEQIGSALTCKGLTSCSVEAAGDGLGLLLKRLHQPNELVLTADIVGDVASKDGWDCISRLSWLELCSSSCCCGTSLINPLKFKSSVLELKKGP